MGGGLAEDRRTRRPCCSRSRSRRARFAARKLVEIGAELGSDIPFFLTGGTATAFGRGTEFYPLPDLAAEPILVAATGVHVATGPRMPRSAVN
jgi:hypothetical protein